jgi:ureidoglycolate hydrolase
MSEASHTEAFNGDGRQGVTYHATEYFAQEQAELEAVAA